MSIILQRNLLQTIYTDFEEDEIKANPSKKSKLNADHMSDDEDDEEK